MLGPERLPGLASDLARIVRRVRDLVMTNKSELEDRLGAEIDFASLDPRKYDPRAIVRDALTAPPAASPRAGGTTAAPASAAWAAGWGARHEHSGDPATPGSATGAADPAGDDPVELRESA